MSSDTPRMRMFAGPNGSGKSILKQKFPAELIGVYINPDEIERQIRAGEVDLGKYSVDADTSSLRAFFGKADWVLKKGGSLEGAKSLTVSKNVVRYPHTQSDDYAAAVMADFIRRALIQSRESFTFETVMSSRDKIALHDLAHDAGFRTYLYYVGTEDVETNVLRVKTRAENGGHDVPEEKIRSRYVKSLGLLLEAILATDRAYIFDNSGRIEEFMTFAEWNGSEIDMISGSSPAWFKSAVLDKIAEG